MTCQKLEDDIEKLKSKGITFRLLLHHFAITVSSLLHHCFCQKVMFHHQINNHTSKALLKNIIWSMTSQKLENDIKELKSKASLFDHCCITVSSLFDHWFCQKVKFYYQISNHTRKALIKDKIWSMTSQKLENDIKELKSKASLFHHCCINVSSLFDHCFCQKVLCNLTHPQGIAKW
jgi:hypothetical protein